MLPLGALSVERKNNTQWKFEMCGHNMYREYESHMESPHIDCSIIF
jgi:hypothetical protein